MGQPNMARFRHSWRASVSVSTNINWLAVVPVGRSFPLNSCADYVGMVSFVVIKAAALGVVRIALCRSAVALEADFVVPLAAHARHFSLRSSDCTISTGPAYRGSAWMDSSLTPFCALVCDRGRSRGRHLRHCALCIRRYL